MSKPPSIRRLRKLETKTRIVNATRELIAEHGLTGFKTLEVAKRAKIAHGSVFVHFANKETLLLFVIETFGTALTKRIHKSTDNQQGLQLVLQTHLTILQENESFYIALIEGRRQLPQEAKEMLISIQSAISFHIGTSGEEEMNKGIIKNIPVYLLFNTWLGLIHYYLTNRELFTPKGSVLKQKGDELISHFMNLIKNR